MTRLLLAFLFAFLAQTCGAAEESVALESAPIDVRDSVSLQAGARTFVNYCLNCHSASAMRYSRLHDLGLSDRQIKDNLLFTSDKLSDMMTVALSKKDATDWSLPAPDLSDIARSRGADWLWTYMRGFYRDPSSNTGWNNTVFPGVGMPHILWKLQGERVLTEEQAKDASGKPLTDSEGHPVKVGKFQVIKQGSLSPAAYDAVVRDLVNFLVWMGDPNQVFRRQVGIVVVAFLFGMMVLTYFLYKEFWKDVH